MQQNKAHDAKRHSNILKFEGIKSLNNPMLLCNQRDKIQNFHQPLKIVFNCN
jgi:hypothetical protein